MALSTPVLLLPFTPTAYGVLAVLGVIAVTYTSALLVYRLYLSPIASFPGPFLARATFLYEFYYTGIKPGQYHHKIAEMHQKYGPIVRVTPDELHINEHSYFNEIYVSSAKRKTESYYRYFRGSPVSDVTAISAPHDAHRVLRGALDPIFSRAATLRLESDAVSLVKSLCQKLDEAAEAHRVVNLTYAFATLTFSKYEGTKAGIRFLPVISELPQLMQFSIRPILLGLWQDSTQYSHWKQRLMNKLLPQNSVPGTGGKEISAPAAINRLANNQSFRNLLPGDIFYRAMHVTLTGGVPNVASVLALIIFSLLQDSKKQEILREELKPIFANEVEPTLELLHLEKLPYLTGCIKEGLRMMGAHSQRSARVSPDVDIYFQNRKIPKGTPVSMTTYFMSHNPSVFPNPQEFEPARWTCTPDKLKRMNRHYAPFSKGSRDCLGQNLVYMLCYHVIAQLFRPRAPLMTLYQTDVTDVRMFAGLVIPYPKLDSRGMRVTFRKANEESL